MRRPLAWLLIATLVLLSTAQAQPAGAPLSYQGKTVLVTGSTDGLGRELARALAADGAHVIVHGRNAERGQAVVDEITRAGKGSAKFYAADFSSMQAVRDFADTIAKDYPKLNLLVNNAGVAFTGNQPRHASADGHELQFAVNYLAGWVLVNKLRPNLAAAAPSRIVNVASGSAAPIDFDDVMLEKPGAHARGYGQSKLAQVSMTVELAPAFARQGITMISLHPATMMDTTMVRSLGMAPRTSVDEGRDHVMSLIRSPTLEPGAFYLDGKPAEPMDPQPNDAGARAKLVALSAELTGVPFL
ncbi:SDR family NAD(P)-dependent oxidoreductase [Arenimonas daejeonensis]|uniref:SDR family NAD(P)-dependent oxidoreductase n=1 Tax=Arenimonas daejeonensis TaxID=370777 RepID=UPI0011BE3CC7|nr:SDR family NAD(P)-dependent oxidoreductase [Arenimonas daejeonensis]